MLGIFYTMSSSISRKTEDAKTLRVHNMAKVDGFCVMQIWAPYMYVYQNIGEDWG